MAACNVVVDLSHNNADVDLAQAKAGGVRGLIHKATQGTGFSDPTYSARSRCVQTGRPPVRRIHLATAADPAAQARFFPRAAQFSPGDLLVLDFEWNQASPNHTMTLDQARVFVSTVQDAAGITPGLYGGRI
jgi:lysozyme